MTLLLIVLLPFLGALLPALLVRRSRAASAWSAGAVAAAAMALLLSLAPRVLGGETVGAGWDWVPTLGLRLSFRVDGLGFLFAFLVIGIGLLVILYARRYLDETDPMGRFYAYLLLFMGAMLGIVLSDNLLLLAVFWELTSLTSFVLIGYWQHRADARQGARMALAVTGGGGLALLGGVVLLGHIAGTFELSEVLLSSETIQASPLYIPALLLVLLGAFTKSAQFPFHFWLPRAMAAPTPVSAYLHSAAMVKAGVFLLARLWPALAGSAAWLFLVGGVGLATFIVGAYLAILDHDLKGLLAYSTVSHLGLITMLFGLGTPAAAVVGIFHIINHCAFKASLFMSAGIVDHEAGTRDMRRLGGLWSAMPFTATLAVLAAAAMGGIPPLNGFLSKEMFLAETLELTSLGDAWWAVAAAATLGALLSVAYSVRFVGDTFLGRPPEEPPKRPHEPPRSMRLPVELLVAACVLIGFFPELAVEPVLGTASAATIGAEPPAYSLALWHGLNLPLLLSAVAIAGGLALYPARRGFFHVHEEILPGIDAKILYDGFVSGLHSFASGFTRGLQNGSLQRYLAVLFLTVLLVAASPFLTLGLELGPRPLTEIDALSLTGWLMLLVGALGAVVLHRNRFVAVIFLSVVGLLVALVFVHFSAPDLALTQISVEVVTIVLMLLVLHNLPQKTPAESSRRRRLRDGGVAMLAGVGGAALTWAVLSRPLDSISRFHLDRSVPGGGGTNVVNVILVDFRGFDTFGEITVLAIAALGIYALIDELIVSRAGPPAGPAVALGSRLGDEGLHPLLVTTVVRLLLPLALLVSFYLFLRGHNLPGGGFIAGLVTAVALVLQYIASGRAWSEDRLPADFHPVIAAGVFCAGLTGVGSWIFGAPFLTSAFDHFHLPLFGDVELATPLLFDLGVYLTVVGAVMLALANLGRLGQREAPARAPGPGGEPGPDGRPGPDDTAVGSREEA